MSIPMATISNGNGSTIQINTRPDDIQNRIDGELQIVIQIFKIQIYYFTSIERKKNNKSFSISLKLK